MADGYKTLFLILNFVKNIVKFPFQPVKLMLYDIPCILNWDWCELQLRKSPKRDEKKIFKVYKS